jgi:hypothetical protein
MDHFGINLLIPILSLIIPWRSKKIFAFEGFLEETILFFATGCI